MAVLVYAVAALFFVSYRLYRIYYNLYLHPLAKVPGPKLYAISWIPRVWKQQFAGTHWKDVVGLHEKYGGIVRTGPDEVSNASARSWDDICGTSRTFPRDLNFLRITQLSTEGASFLSRDREGHHFVRRLLQPALTDRAMAPREAMLRQWTQKLRLSIEGEGGGEFDVGRRLCWFTFDTMGDMAFGESFGCLDNNRQHPYLTAVELGAPFLSVLQVVLRFKVTRWLYDLCTRLPWMALWNSLRGVSDDKTARWLDSVGDEDRQDFMSTIYRAMRDEDRPITMQQAKDLASILCLAGAESTPVLMAGMMWWILSMPRVHARLRDEIRHSGVIRSADDITVKNVSAFSYLDAVIMEGLRLNTPFSVAIPRIVPEGGAMVDGYFLPEGTVCGVPQWASGNWERNFAEPETFAPERWLARGVRDAKYDNDKRDSFKPFAKGSLDCIGKRMVYHEVRMVMATLFWYFDMELQPRSFDWVSGANATVRIMREKKPLYIKAIRRDT